MLRCLLVVTLCFASLGCGRSVYDSDAAMLGGMLSKHVIVRLRRDVLNEEHGSYSREGKLRSVSKTGVLIDWRYGSSDRKPLTRPLWIPREVILSIESDS